MQKPTSEAPERGAKRARLRQSGTLNPHPERVVDPLFAGSDFFDAEDLVQVKYEMLRRVEVDQAPVGQAVEAFGYSRPVYYAARATFETQGLGGLVPAKRGPKGGHKLTPEVLAYLDGLRAAERLSAADLARRAAEHFGVQIHPRSIERARARGKKTSRGR